MKGTEGCLPPWRESTSLGADVFLQEVVSPGLLVAPIFHMSTVAAGGE